MPVKTKFQHVKDLVQEETAWSSGTDHPWKGDALLSPWFLERLCLLASYAPQREIERLKKACET